MAKPLKKEKKPGAEKKPANSETVWVQLGTPREFDEKKRYDTAGAAIKAVAHHFHSQDGFITRSVREKDDVFKAIDTVNTEVGSSYIGATPKTFEVLIDPYYNMRLAAKIWRGPK